MIANCLVLHCFHVQHFYKLQIHLTAVLGTCSIGGSFHLRKHGICVRISFVQQLTKLPRT